MTLTKNLKAVTDEFLHLKRRFNPRYAESLRHDLRIMIYEIKGSDIRSDIRSASRNKRRRALGILDKTLSILERYECRIIAKAYIKEPGGIFDGVAAYTSTIQALYANFENFLDTKDGASGIVVADSRRKGQNNKVSFSIFTKKHRSAGDAYPHIIEMPLFGHSENHVGLQMADWIASALLYPMLSYTYCRGYIISADYNGFCWRYKV